MLSLLTSYYLFNPVTDHLHFSQSLPRTYSDWSRSLDEFLKYFSRTPSVQWQMILRRWVSDLDLTAVESLMTVRIAVWSSNTLAPRCVKIASLAAVPSKREEESVGKIDSGKVIGESVQKQNWSRKRQRGRRTDIETASIWWNQTFNRYHCIGKQIRSHSLINHLHHLLLRRELIVWLWWDKWERRSLSRFLRWPLPPRLLEWISWTTDR